VLVPNSLPAGWKFDNININTIPPSGKEIDIYFSNPKNKQMMWLAETRSVSVNQLPNETRANINGMSAQESTWTNASHQRLSAVSLAYKNTDYAIVGTNVPLRTVEQVMQNLVS
jgi:hypothetical protein